MPNYLSPGVYVEEVSSGAKVIAGVGTSTGAFVGIAEKGIKDKATLVTNWTQYVKEFGSFIPNGYLAYAVYGFFNEGGTSCYVTRVTPSGATPASVTMKDIATKDAVKITTRSEGKWGNRITINIDDASENVKLDENKNKTLFDEKLFKLTVVYQEDEKFQSEYQGDGVIEVFDKISLFDIEEKVNSAFVDVQVLLTDLPKDDKGKKEYKNRLAAGSFPLAGGGDGTDDDGFKDTDFIGDADSKKGLHAFDEVDDINIVAIPDKAGDREVILEALNYCKLRKDCFFVADPPYGLTPVQVKDFKGATGIYMGGNAFNSSYGALYYPWVYISDPLTGKKKMVPPSGVVAGTYAHTDSARGVHKAPAGTDEGYLDSVVGIERIITKGEHDLLNPLGINVIRTLPAGICIWGARTLSADPEWLYINVRRLFMYVEKSVDKASQWVVFEPNDPHLWGSVKRNLIAFLTRTWREGALFGSVPEEAFIVKVDAENNPPEIRDAGQLIIEVAIAPVKPAEFVIIRISQKTLAK
jgi:uncharacterized protein